MSTVRLSSLLLLAAATSATSFLAAPTARALGGGTAAADGAYPFAVKLDVIGSKSCSGVLVHPGLVLTAKSCFGLQTRGKPPATSAIVGRDAVRSETGQVISVSEVIPHPDRQVALAVLSSNARVGKPVALGAAAASGELLRVAGYGRTRDEWVPDRLQTGTFRVDTVSADALGIVGASDAAATTCKGDSGGPTFRERDGSVELVALHGTSFQSGCLGSKETRLSTIEIRVDGLSDWIRKQVPNETCRAAGCRPGAVDPLGALDVVDVPRDGSGVHVRGWAFDPNSARASLDVHVYLGGPAPRMVGSGLADQPRPDVEAAFPSIGNDHGYDFTVPHTTGGGQDICTYALNWEGTPGTNPLLGCKRVRVPNPIGNLDLAAAADGGLRVAGWTLDADGPWVSNGARIAVDGQTFELGPANLVRADVDTSLRGVGAWHGFDAVVPFRLTGNHEVCLIGLNVPGTAGRDERLTCKTVTR